MNENEVELIEKIKQEKDFFEKARLIRLLKKDFDMPLHKISKSIGIKPSYVSHILRLKKLPGLIVDGYYSNAVSISHLFIISRLHKEEDMIAVYEQILKNSFTVFQTEEAVRYILYKIKTEGEFLSNQDKDRLISVAEELNNVKVKIIQTRTKAKLELEAKGSLVETTNIILKIMRKLSF